MVPIVISAKLRNNVTHGKAISGASLPPTLPPIYEEAVLSALRHVAYETDVTVKDIARELGLREPTVYHKLQEEARNQFSLAEFCRVVRLSLSKGEHHLIDLMLPENFEVIDLAACPAESIEAEVTEIVQDAGRAVTNLKQGKITKAQSDAREVVADAQAFARTVRGKR